MPDPKHEGGGKHAGNDWSELMHGDLVGVQYVEDGTPHEVRGRITRLGEDLVEVSVPDITGQDGSKVQILRESITLLRILDHGTALQQAVAWTIYGEPVRVGDKVQLRHRGAEVDLTDRIVEFTGGAGDGPATLYLGEDRTYRQRVFVHEILTFRNLTAHGEEWQAEKVVIGHTPMSLVFYGAYGTAYAWNGDPNAPRPDLITAPLVDRAVLRAMAEDVIAQLDRTPKEP